MSADNSLDDLRAKIDRIDDSLHNMLIRRTRLVEKVRDAKARESVKIRPAREAQILYRLIARHKGHFPKREMVRIWRELICATLPLEGPFSVAVFIADGAPGYWDLARDHYGSFTPFSGYRSAHQVIEAVRRQESTVGVLPMVAIDDDQPWWPSLVSESRDAPRIVARLPFAGPGNGLGGDIGALVISPLAQEPTGRDASYVAIDSEAMIPIHRLAAAFADAGIPARQLFPRHDSQQASVWLYLAEIAGFVASDDRRLPLVAAILGAAVKRVIVLGGYAEPLTEPELA